MELQTILDWVSAYGGPALFMLLMLGIVGLPVPDETLMVFTGYLIQQGHLNLAGTWLFAFLGSSCGITLSFVIGRRLGLPFIHKYGKYLHVTAKRLEKVHKWFDGFGHWTLSFGYFVPGVRHFTAVVAGMSGLSTPVFALYAYSGAAVWVSVFIGLGYLLGERWKEAAESAHRYIGWVAGLAVLLGLGYLLFARRKR